MESELYTDMSSAFGGEWDIGAVGLLDSFPWSRSDQFTSQRNFPVVLNQFAENQDYSIDSHSNGKQCTFAQATEERSTNTSEEWESCIRAMDDLSVGLTKEYEAFKKQQAGEQQEHDVCVHNLEKKKEEINQQYQNYIGKIESLHVKLELNSSKTARKTFLVKQQELNAEKERLEMENARMAQELEDTEKKRSMLLEEQSQEKLTWEQEIANLRLEMETLCRQAEQANQTALQDEIAALEMQKQLAVSQVEDWIADAEKYMNFLRLNPSQDHFSQLQRWEQNLATVRNGLVVLRNKFNENHQLLERGEQLESLPSVSLPSLPPVPTLELMMNQAQNPVSNFHFHNPRSSASASLPSSVHPKLQNTATASQRCTAPLSASNAPYLAASAALQSSHIHAPKPRFTLSTAPATQISMQTTCPPQIISHRPVTLPTQTLPQAHLGRPGVSVSPSVASERTCVGSLNNPPGFYPQAPVGFSQTYLPAPVSQPLPSHPAPAGKLDKLLEKLGLHFPQCSRDQLTRVLQQIKSERGTMAGLTIDDVTKHVAQRLAQNRLQPPGPPGARPFSPSIGPIQRPAAQPMRPSYRPAVPHVFNTRPPQSRKFCLICQNAVDAGNQHKTNCPHTMHIDCVSVWLKTSKNISCPFCPSN